MRARELVNTFCDEMMLKLKPSNFKLRKPLFYYLYWFNYINLYHCSLFCQIVVRPSSTSTPLYYFFSLIHWLIKCIFSMSSVVSFCYLFKLPLLTLNEGRVTLYGVRRGKNSGMNTIYNLNILNDDTDLRRYRSFLSLFAAFVCILDAFIPKPFLFRVNIFGRDWWTACREFQS